MSITALGRDGGGAMKAIIAAGIAAVGLLLAVGTAHASPAPVIYGESGDQDAGLYSLELGALGLRGNASDAAQIAATVCGVMRRYEPGGSLRPPELDQADQEAVDKLRSIAASKGKTISEDIVWYIVFGAQYHFCPEYR